MRRRLFTWLADSLDRHRAIWWTLLIATFAASAAWLATGHLAIQTSRNSVADADDPEQVKLQAYSELFGAGSDLIVLLESDDPVALREAADKAAARLEEAPEVAGVYYRMSLDAMAHNGLYYLDTADWERVEKNLGLILPEPEPGAPRGKPVKLEGVIDALRRVESGIEAFVDGEVGGGMAAPADADLDQALSLLVGLIDETAVWLAEPERDQFDLRTSFKDRGGPLQLDKDGYLVARDGTLLLMQIRSREDMLDETHAVPLVDAVRSALEASAVMGVSWGITGVPAMVAEERTALTRDIWWTSVLSAVGCLLLFLLAYRSLGSTATAFVPLVVGITWGLALTAVVIGSLNLITSVFAVIVIGMGIDFSVHLLTRIREERKTAGNRAEAVRRAMAGAGPPVFMGAITSAAAFGAMALADFRATRELGIIASSGLLLVMVATFTVVPLLLNQRRRADRPMTAAPSPKFVWPRPLSWPLLAAGVAVTIGLGLTIRPVAFNFDIETFLPDGSDALAALHRLEAHDIGGVQFAVTLAPSMAASRAQLTELEALREKGVISRIESIFDVMPPDLEAKEAIIARVRTRVGAFPGVNFEPAPEAGAKDLVETTGTVIELIESDLLFELRRLGLKEPQKRLEPLVDALRRLQTTARGLDQQTLATRLGRFETRVARLSGYVTRFLETTEPLTAEQLPASMVSTFFQSRGDEATYAIRVYPAGDSDDPAVNAAFTAALRGIDANATGYAITQTHYAVLMQQSLMQAGLYSLVLVLLLVLLDLRRLGDVLLALVPLAAGAVWMVGLMNVFGIDYTFANVLAIPLIIGIGIDSGLHVIHRWRECGFDVGETLRTTGKAVLVSSLTTMIAFGTMALASSPGARGLALTLVIGVGACALIALTVLPALLALVRPIRTR